jgi:hypothetical protein
MFKSISVQGIWAGILFAIRHWALIMSLLTFPKLPDDWSNKEKVRVFIIELASSDAAHELTKLVSTRWTENVRASVVLLANQPTLWNMAWDIIYNADSSIGIDTIVEPKSLRERIRNRFKHALPVSASEAAMTVEGVKDLATALQTVRLVFDKARD